MICVVYHTIGAVQHFYRNLLCVYFLGFFIHIGSNMYTQSTLIGISFIEISCTFVFQNLQK
jgi:hypothetical protein